jgi:hypothetical protein
MCCHIEMLRNAIPDCLSESEVNLLNVSQMCLFVIHFAELVFLTLPHGQPLLNAGMRAGVLIILRQRQLYDGL